MPSPPRPAADGLLRPASRPAIPGGGPQTTAEILDRVVAETPDAEALVGRHGRFTFASLDQQVNRAAQALVALGVGPGDRVAACLPNDVDLPIAFLATQRLGAVWVGINRILAPPEKAHILEDSGARVFLVADELARELDGGVAPLPTLEHVVPVDPTTDTVGWRARCARAPARRPEVEIDPFEPAAIAYTSGTTGVPKGAVHSQHNLLLPGAVFHLTERFEPDTRQGAVLALTILNLVVLEVLAPWYDRRCLVCIDRSDATGLADWIREEGVGAFWGVPTILHDLLASPDVKPEDLATLRHPGVGGSDVPPEMMALYRERFGRNVNIGYGMTEAPTAVTAGEGFDGAPPGLCGRPVEQCAIEVRDDEGRVLPPGEIGEICVRAAESGPFAGVYTPMLGYWRRPDATAEALRDGVYHTGDLGTFLEDGNLTIRGRRGELILRGGANVYPAEVERALAAHPDVAFAAVLGVADERLGQRVVAAVEAAEGAAAPDAESLRRFCSERIARYKVPDRIEIVDELPRNAMGKVQKHRLVPRFQAR